MGWELAFTASMALEGPCLARRVCAQRSRGLTHALPSFVHGRITRIFSCLVPPWIRHPTVMEAGT